jgi:hypothetical protein
MNDFAMTAAWDDVPPPAINIFNPVCVKFLLPPHKK